MAAALGVLALLLQPGLVAVAVGCKLWEGVAELEVLLAAGQERCQYPLVLVMLAQVRVRTLQAGRACLAVHLALVRQHPLTQRAMLVLALSLVGRLAVQAAA